MRKVFGIILIISFGYFSVSIISAQERKRRVETSVSSSASTPPTATASAIPEEVGTGDIIRVDTSLVTIPVSVRDWQGRFIYDLGKEDFSVYENGVRQETAFFEAVETPFNVILMLDTSSSTRLKHEQIKDVAIAFINQLRPADRVMVVSFANEITVEIEPTTDRTALQQAIRKVGKGWNTRLYDAVDWAIKGPLKLSQGRKAVVLLTDGRSRLTTHSTPRRTSISVITVCANQVEGCLPGAA